MKTSKISTNFKHRNYSNKQGYKLYGLLAQLDKALDYESRDCRFKSCVAHFFFKIFISAFLMFISENANSEKAIKIYFYFYLKGVNDETVKYYPHSSHHDIKHAALTNFGN
jgi:hypothetical protein